MILVALTGGIAAGKSTVAARLAEHGAQVVDADQLARDAVAPGSAGLAAVRARFGDAVVDGSGALDRAALAAVVFGDEAARAELEAIVHPRVRALLAQAVTRIRAENPDAVVVYDVPLLAETGGRRGDFDRVVTVEADEAVRLDRLQRLRGMSRADAEARLHAQAAAAERIALADDVIDSSGSLECTLAAVDALWARWTRA